MAELFVPGDMVCFVDVCADMGYSMRQGFVIAAESPVRSGGCADTVTVLWSASCSVDTICPCRLIGNNTLWDDMIVSCNTHGLYSMEGRTTQTSGLTLSEK